MHGFAQHRPKLLVTITLLLVSVALDSTGVQAAKPAPPPPPPPPPVQYGIQFWTTPLSGAVQINAMNNLGQVVGKCWNSAGAETHGFLYDPWINPDAAIDLTTLDIAGIPEDWTIATASGISDNGVIVGHLIKKGAASYGSTRQGYVLDTRVTPYVLEVLPYPLLSGYPDDPYYWWLRINNSGDILISCQQTNGFMGAYIYRWGTTKEVIDSSVDTTGATVYLNSATEVALNIADGSSSGLACRWDPLTGTLEPLGGTNTRVSGINDSGTVCGGTDVYMKPPKKPARYYTYPFRYTDSLEVLYGVTGSAIAINSSGDLLCGSYIYQDALAEFFSIDSLIDPTDPAAAEWSRKSSATASAMNDRIGETRFGEIVGTITFADGRRKCFLLTP